MPYKLRYQTQNRQMLFEIEGETQKDVFRHLAEIEEIFDSQHKCGACSGADIRHRVRVAVKGSKKYEFFELHCQNQQCRARFSFGQSMEGGALFPARKDKDGNWLENNGWVRYRGGDSGSDTGQADQGGENSPW